MSDVSIHISFPLDEDGYFRRECPYCLTEFKAKISEKDMHCFTQHLFDNYLSKELSEDGNEDSDDNEAQEKEYFCPYCGQTADPVNGGHKSNLIMR